MNMIIHYSCTQPPEACYATGKGGWCRLPLTMIPGEMGAGPHLESLVDIITTTSHKHDIIDIRSSYDQVRVQLQLTLLGLKRNNS